MDRELSEFKLKEIDKDKLYEFLREMEFNRLLSSVISAYGEPNLKNIDEKKDKTENLKPINNKNYKLILNIDEISEWINEAEEIGEIAVDTETDSIDPHQANLVGISLSTKIGKACYIPVGHKSKQSLNKKEVLKKLNLFWKIQV